MAARAHHAPPDHEEDVMRTEVILLKPQPYLYCGISEGLRNVVDFGIGEIPGIVAQSSYVSASLGVSAGFWRWHGS